MNRQRPISLAPRRQRLESCASSPSGTERTAAYAHRLFFVLWGAANAFMRSIHTRMPVILSPKHERAWLDEGAPLSDLFAILDSPRPGLTAYAVSPAVNRASVDEAQLIRTAA